MGRVLVWSVVVLACVVFAVSWAWLVFDWGVDTPDLSTESVGVAADWLRVKVEATLRAH